MHTNEINNLLPTHRFYTQYDKAVWLAFHHVLIGNGAAPKGRDRVMRTISCFQSTIKRRLHWRK